MVPYFPIIKIWSFIVTSFNDDDMFIELIPTRELLNSNFFVDIYQINFMIHLRGLFDTGDSCKAGKRLI